MNTPASESGDKTIRLRGGGSTVAVRDPKISIRQLNFYYGQFHALHDIRLDIPGTNNTA